jgi:uncharacterized protein YlxP (DUF503 family)
MVVGVCRLTLAIAGSTSLKDKRRVVKSLTERVRNRFNVAVAEVDAHEIWNTAVLGVVCVSTGRAHADEVLAHVVDFVQGGHGDAELVDYSVEIVPGF